MFIYDSSRAFWVSRTLIPIWLHNKADAAGWKGNSIDTNIFEPTQARLQRDSKSSGRKFLIIGLLGIMAERGELAISGRVLALATGNHIVGLVDPEQIENDHISELLKGDKPNVGATS